MLQDKGDYRHQWQKLLEAAADIQGLLPGAVLVGGSAASIHLEHRFSFAADHILLNLKENYEEVLDFLEGRDDWETARIHPPKLILGNFRSVETGIRQLMRRRPLETMEIQTGTGKSITVPTVAEMLRTKAWMIVSRNATRDFMDFAALAGHLGVEQAVTVLEDLDACYLDRIDVSRYKGIRPPFDSWEHIVAICTRISVELGNRIADSPV